MRPERGDLIRHVRGIAKAMGAALPSNWSTAAFAERLRERLPALPPTFREFPVESMRAAIDALSEAIKDYERQMDRYTAEYFPEEVNRLRTIPGVGRIVSNVFVAVIGDTERFRRARDAGPYLGLVPGRDSSSEKDETKAISKEGNPFGGWCTNLMRHTRVSYWLAQCRNPVLVAAEGGHTQDVMHRHYANLRIPAAHVTAFWRIGP